MITTNLQIFRLLDIRHLDIRHLDIWTFEHLDIWICGVSQSALWMLRIFQKHTKAKPSRHMGGMRGCGSLDAFPRISRAALNRKRRFALRLVCAPARGVRNPIEACFFCYSPCAPCLPCPPCLPTMPAYQRGPIALPQLQHLVILARIHFLYVLGHRHFLTRIFFTACLLSSWPCIYSKTSIYLSTHAIASYPLLPEDMILRLH